MSNYPPIQTSTSAIISTPESLRDEIDKLNKTIDSLSSVLDTERVLIRSMEQNVDRLIEYLMNLTESGDLEGYVAEELADIFGRTLIRTVSVRVTADIDIEINVPVGYDLDDLDGDLEVEVTSAYSADVEIVNSESASIQVEV